MSKFASRSLPPELSGWEGDGRLVLPVLGHRLPPQGEAVSQAVSPQTLRDRKHMPLGLSLRLPVNPALPLACSKGSWSSACERVRTGFPASLH